MSLNALRSIKRINQRASGFTIVELLIVIVVIGILAAIVIVAFNGISARATFTKAQSELSSINKALAAYNTQKGAYPATAVPGTAVWVYSCESGAANFIPELISEGVLKSIPQAPCKNSSDRSDSWVYASDGSGYKLLHIRPDTAVAANAPEALQDNRYPTNSTWGYWSPDWVNR